MKTIFLGEAASDSGSLGFSEACPLIAVLLAGCSSQFSQPSSLTILPRLHARSCVPQYRQ